MGMATPAFRSAMMGPFQMRRPPLSERKLGHEAVAKKSKEAVLAHRLFAKRNVPEPIDVKVILPINFLLISAK